MQPILKQRWIARSGALSLFLASCASSTGDGSKLTAASGPETLDTFMANPAAALTVHHRADMDPSQYTSRVRVAGGILTINFYLPPDRNLDGEKVTFNIAGMHDFVGFKGGELASLDRDDAMRLLKVGGERTLCGNQIVEGVMDATADGQKLAAKATLGVGALPSQPAVHTSSLQNLDDFCMEDGLDDFGDPWDCGGDDGDWGGGGGGDPWGGGSITCSPTSGDANASCQVSADDDICHHDRSCFYSVPAKYPDGTPFCQSVWSACAGYVMAGTSHCYCQ